MPAAVWSYGVSGLHVLGSWLKYRMRDGGGRRSSKLDEARPAVWPATFTEELLRVLWILEHTVVLQPALDGVLEKVAAGETIAADEPPVPTEAERAPPGE